MTQRDFDIDVLKALSIIEGAVRATGNTELTQVIEDELEWIINSIVNGLKRSNNEFKQIPKE